MVASNMTFETLLEAIENLSLEDRQSLIDLVQRRISEAAGKKIAASARAAKRDHQRGKSRPATAAQMMDEILVIDSRKAPTWPVRIR
jgi:hypothetical protein